MNRDRSVIFEIVPKYCILDSFVDYDGYSISSEGFLPTVVDIMVIWVNTPIPVHFSLLIPKMSTFTLAISRLTTSSLPWFMNLTFQVPMQYCALQHRTLLPPPVISTTQCWFCFGSVSSFFLELFLHWSPLAYWARTDLGRSCFSVLFFCLFIPFMGFSRQEYWNGLLFPFLVDHVLSDLYTIAHLSCVALHGMAHTFTELDKAVVHVSDWLVFCEYGFSVSSLWCPLATPTVLLGFLLPWRWGISSVQQSTATAPYLGWGVSPHGRPSWLEHGVAPL